MKFKEVTHDEFFAAIGGLDVCPRIVGKYDGGYSDFETRGTRRVVGRIENTPKRYLLAEG